MSVVLGNTKLFVIENTAWRDFGVKQIYVFMYWPQIRS